MTDREFENYMSQLQFLIFWKFPQNNQLSRFSQIQQLIFKCPFSSLFQFLSLQRLKGIQVNPQLLLMVRKTLVQAIKAFDFFCQPATFRYGDQPDYQSLTGGVCSIIIFVVFAVLFTNHIIETFNKVSIESTYTTLQEEDPSYYQIGTDNFMFAIQVKDMDMNQGQMYFSVLMEKIDIVGSYGQNKTRTKKVVNLQKCEKQQWVRINPNMSSIYDKLEFSKWLCPPDGMKIQLQGKFSSDIFRYYKIGIKQCSVSEAASLNRTCATSDKIEKYLNASESFIFNYYYLNTIINPSNHQFIQTYLDDLNYFYFTTTDGVTANFFLSNYQIETDQSIYPVVANTTVKGAISTTTAQTINFKLRTSTQYMKFYIRKSSLSIRIQRSFKKLEATLSYIGGLFSAILSALFIIKKYNQLSYQMQIAKNLYHYDKNEPLKSESFNFLVFIGYLIYAFFETIRIRLPWDRMEVYFRSLEEVRKQMDIRLVMKKILYSERMAIAVFDEPKAKILHLQEPLTLEEAERIRKDHRFYDKLQSKYFDYKKIKEQQQLQNEEIDQNLQIEMNSQQVNNNGTKKPKQPVSVSIQQIILPAQKQGKTINIHKSLSRRGRINLKKYYNKKKQAEKQERAKGNLSKIFNFIKSEEKRKQEQMEKMIEQMKTHVMILKEEAQNGDIISEHILDRFDPKLMKMFILNQQDKKTEERKRRMSISNYTIDLIPQKREKGEFPFSSSSIMESKDQKK